MGIMMARCRISNCRQEKGDYALVSTSAAAAWCSTPVFYSGGGRRSRKQVTKASRISATDLIGMLQAPGIPAPSLDGAIQPHLSSARKSGVTTTYSVVAAAARVPTARSGFNRSRREAGGRGRYVAIHLGRASKWSPAIRAVFPNTACSLSPLPTFSKSGYNTPHGIHQIHLLAGSRPVAWLLTRLS